MIYLYLHLQKSFTHFSFIFSKDCVKHSVLTTTKKQVFTKIIAAHNL